MNRKGRGLCVLIGLSWLRYVIMAAFCENGSDFVS
jgi:hypothetical protein